VTKDESAALQAIADARTALDDPGGIPEEEMQPYVEEAEVMDRVYAEAARSPNIAYAIARLDEAVKLLYDEGAPTPAAQIDTAIRQAFPGDLVRQAVATTLVDRSVPVAVAIVLTQDFEYGDFAKLVDDLEPAEEELDA
jgi:hypothetical protein